MLSASQPQSRWTAFIERWDARLIRFRQCFDPTAEAPDRKMRIWATVILSIGVLLLSGLIVYGVMWIIDHRPALGLIYLLLKVGKYVVVGVGIIIAILCRDWLASLPMFARFRSGGATTTKE